MTSYELAEKIKKVSEGLTTELTNISDLYKRRTQLRREYETLDREYDSAIERYEQLKKEMAELLGDSDNE